MNKEIKLEHVGEICPLCHNGLITYVNLKGGVFFTNLHYEYTTCSNDNCKGAVKIKDESL